MKTLTLEQVEALLTVVTEHDRTSCSDFDISNQYPHYDDGTSCCARCVLVFASKYGYTPTVEIEVRAKGI